MSQRLVRRLCPECHGAKCEHCGRAGYEGRVFVSELLRMNAEISEAVPNGKSGRELSDMARQNGFKSLAGASRDLIDGKITDQAEIVRIADTF